MSKKKSLGSSPIASLSGKSTMTFIPDRAASDKKGEKSLNRSLNQPKKSADDRELNESSSDGNKEEKKTVSYYLKKDLIAQIRSIANENDMYYSALVTTALESWITDNS